MRRALDVRRLPRATRLRCRPFLIDPPIGFLARTKSYAAAAPRPAEEEREERTVPSFGSRRAEYSDYAMSVKMAKEREAKGRKGKAVARPDESTSRCSVALNLGIAERV
ncbi:hypothetical protein JCM24511_04685 [Saitozyma sp. JCM 24511]|nr:hypothetical protein JCM24511_04685 [Saitozyma sp. JCM 24511]